MFEAFDTEVYSVEAGDKVFVHGEGRVVVNKVEVGPELSGVVLCVFPHKRFWFPYDARVTVWGTVDDETCYAEPGAGFGGE